MMPLMKWERASVTLRLIFVTVSAAGFGAAWRLTWMGAQGVEDIPPPFTLAAGLLGLAGLLLAVVGRYPVPDPGRG